MCVVRERGEAILCEIEEKIGVTKRASPSRIGPFRAWSAKIRVGLARPAKLLRLRIRAGARVCGPARIFFFFLN